MTTWSSARWRDHFAHNLDHLLDLPWDDAGRLTQAERRAVAASLAQFQLGEGSDGQHFLRQAQRYAAASGDLAYVEALRLFIGEEQRHSRDLGRFLDREGLPRLRAHWTDGVFRRLRRLMGLDLCVSVLVTAEIVARVYYQALREATASRLLRRLCDQILRDEAAHVAFQCGMLHRLRQGWRPWQREGAAWMQRLFMLGTLAVVWLCHHRVYRAAGYSLFRYAGETLIELEKALGVVRHPEAGEQLLQESVLPPPRAPFHVGATVYGVLFPGDEV